MQRASAKVVVKALGAVAEKDIARFPMLSGHSCGVVPVIDTMYGVPSVVDGLSGAEQDLLMK